MNDFPRRKLYELIASEGRSLCENPPRCRALLESACAEYPREVDVLLRALDDQVAAKLLVLSDGMAWTSVAATLAGRLSEEAGLELEDARWAVDSWAFALGKGPGKSAEMPVGNFLELLQPAQTKNKGPWRMVLKMVCCLLLLGGIPGFIWWYNQRPEIRRMEGHSGYVTRVVFFPAGQSLLSGGYDKTLRIWDVQTGQEKARLDGKQGYITALAVSPDGQRALSGGGVVESRQGKWQTYDSDTVLWDLENKQEVLRFDGDRGLVLSLAWAPNGQFAVSGGGSNEFDQAGQPVLKDAKPVFLDTHVRLWDLRSGKPAKVLEGHKNLIHSVAVSPDSRQILSGSSDGSVRLWDVETGKEQKRFETEKAVIYAAAFCRDGKTALVALDIRSGNPLPVVRRIDLQSGEELQRYLGHASVVLGLAVSPDGQRLLTASADFTVRLWDLESGQELRRFKGHTNTVSSVAFAPDGQTAVSSGGDGTLRLWKLPSP